MKVVMIVVLIFSMNCLASNNAKDPKLKFIGKRVINMGVVKEGIIISQKFFFTNTGNYPLIIKDITKSCNCTEVILKEPNTLPRDTNYMTITVNTKGKVGVNVVDVVLNTNTQQKEHIAKLIMEVEK